MSPLQVEEVKKHSHCLAFSSAGPQSQTYYVSFDSFTEHLRWHRHAAKVTAAATRNKTNSPLVRLLVSLLVSFIQICYIQSRTLIIAIKSVGCCFAYRFSLRKRSLHVSACSQCVDRRNNTAHPQTSVPGLFTFCQFFGLFHKRK